MNITDADIRSGNWKEMKMAGRQWRRHFERAIRKSWIRALAELITNSDDSYTRLEKVGGTSSGLIVVEYLRSKDRANFRVLDEAEGMGTEKVRRVFEEYGGEIAAGDETRGFFNRGAKDALLAMEEGREETIRDDLYTSVELRLGSTGKPEIRIIGPVKANKNTRRRLGVESNGTVASFAVPAHHERTPQVETVRTALAKFWMLRKIVDPANPKRKLVLRYRHQEMEILYPAPVGEVILDEEFDLEGGPFPPFPFRLVIKRAEEALDQSPNSDQRVGGLLVVDEGDAVLDLTLGRFDRDPSAAKFFGELKILKGFKDFLRHEERDGRLVLSEERNGFEETHPWVQVLLREIEKRIEPFVVAEREAKAASASRLTEDEVRHQQRIMEELNRILEEETKASWEGLEKSDVEVPPATGLAIKPNPLVVTEGTPRYAAILVDPAKCEPGSVIVVEDEAGSLTIEPSEIKVEKERGPVFVRSIRIEGGTAGEKGKIVAVSQSLGASAQYEVVAAAYPPFEGEMAFLPDDVAVVDQKVGTLGLYVRTDHIPIGDPINIVSSDPEKVRALAGSVTVDSRDVRQGVGKIRVRARGMGVGQRATVTASYGSIVATAQVRVRSEQTSPPPGKKGLFRAIKYDETAPPQQRVHYDNHAGEIAIHLREPTVMLHLGKTGEFRNLLDAQTLVADLVTQCFAQEVARRKIESGARPYFGSTPEERLREDLQEIEYQIYKHGAAIHSLVVDQDLIRDARESKVNEAIA